MDCHGCGNSWRTYEEKETDVNIAVALVAGGVRDDFDTYWPASSAARRSSSPLASHARLRFDSESGSRMPASTS